MSQFYNDSIFWVEVDKIKPNPYQPRKEFDPVALQALADSIKQYGVLQALVVTRKENFGEDGLKVEYELIAGERRLRASRLAGLREVPVLIRAGEENDLMKLELAIIENVQREDLNAVERARAFKKLVDEFGFKHITIAQKIGKSREYVSNTLRLLSLPEEIQNAVSEGKITEGHTRPLLMLSDRPQEQSVLFKEVLYKKISVREAELIARKIAVERARVITPEMDPVVFEFEEKFSESLGTRVQIERKKTGGKLMIDFFSYDDLNAIFELLKNKKASSRNEMMERYEESEKSKVHKVESQNIEPKKEEEVDKIEIATTAEDDRTPEDIKKDDNTLIPNAASPGGRASLGKEDQDIYSVKNFSL